MKIECGYCYGKGYITNTYKTYFKKCPICEGTREVEEVESKSTTSVDEDLDYFFNEVLGEEEGEDDIRTI